MTRGDGKALPAGQRLRHDPWGDVELSRPGTVPGRMHGEIASAAPGRRSRSNRLADLLDRTGLLRRLAGRGTWHGLLTLTYHRIGSEQDSPWDRALYSATQEEFAAHLRYFKRHAQIVGPSGLDAALQARRGRHIAITFDDGYRDNHTLALPVLRAEGVAATWFLVSGFVDRPRIAWWDEVAWMVRHAVARRLPAGPWLQRSLDLHTPGAAAELLCVLTALPGEHVPGLLEWLGQATGAGRPGSEPAADMWMTWDMVRELQAAGMGIGGHTVDHPVLARCTPAEQEAQIEGSLLRLQEELGERPRLFSYPVGGRTAFDDTTKALVRAAGVDLAFSFTGGYEPAGGLTDRLAVRRTYVGRDLSPAAVRARVALPQLYAREIA